MKKQQNKVDEFFRDALQDHTVVPSDVAKSAFLKEAANLEGSGKSKKYLYLYLAALLVIVSAGAGLLLIHQNKFKPTSSVSSSPVTTKSSSSSTTFNKKKPDAFISSKQSESVSTFNNEFTTTKNSADKTQIASKEKNQNNTGSINLTEIKTSKRNEITQPVIPTAKTETGTTVKTPAETKTSIAVAEQGSPVSTRAEEKVAKKEVPYSPPGKSVDTLTTDKTTNTAHITGAAQAPRTWNVSLSGYYSPEWLFNTLEGEKYVNNFGIEGTFHFGRYSIRTGAGLSITKGTNELSVNYNDYLGHYNKLDSIQFNWNVTHSKLLPTYYFTHENVWDSLLKTADAKVVKRYTYLQVPLILGYDFWQNENFSLGLRAGPILSVLLKTEVLSDNYDPGMNKIILINRIAPERIQTNWQILGGINATMHFSRRLGFELEPEIRYYFNSVYEKSDIDKKPWSLGFRAAFLIKN